MSKLEYRWDYIEYSGESRIFKHRIVIRYARASRVYGYPVDFKEDYLSNILEWLNENIGIVRKDWHLSKTSSSFYFIEKESAMAFMLTWS